MIGIGEPGHSGARLQREHHVERRAGALTDAGATRRLQVQRQREQHFPRAQRRRGASREGAPPRSGSGLGLVGQIQRAAVVPLVELVARLAEQLSRFDDPRRRLAGRQLQGLQGDLGFGHRRSRFRPAGERLQLGHRAHHFASRGVHLALEKSRQVTMDSATVGIPRDSPAGYYRKVAWATRLSYSGTYVHAAPWSTGSQGERNVSHGCINVSTADAQWFYGFTQRGDVVTVVNSNAKPLLYDPGMADWNIPWDQWKAGDTAR